MSSPRSAKRSIGQFFSLTRSHVCSELERLCRLGLLDVTGAAGAFSDQAGV
jgi:hypothetical protein